jgi:hypothetical protein
MGLFSPVCEIKLWAPFLNFKKSSGCILEVSISKIKNDYLKHPWATHEDHD